MHVCKDAFRRRNSFLHQLKNAIKADEVNKADKAIEASKENEAEEISRRNK